MTKTQTWTEVQKLFESHKVSKALQAELAELLQPKSSGSINPPKLDKDGNVIEAWCRWHARYEPIKDHVLSNNKTKGYCRESLSKWTKANNQVKKLQAESAEALEADNLELAKSKAQEAKALKEVMNTPAYFNEA